MPCVRIARTAVFGVLVTLALAVPAAAPETAVRVWRGSLQIPTYAEDAPNPNPPFDLFTFGRFNYPYPIRDALTDRREPVSWRTLNLENEYLRLTVLPDLGGHIYSCLDKRDGREMFYANTTIKKALIGYRGAWAAFGVEFNFPVSHNWVSMSPVDFALVEHPDGSGSIWVGNVDQVYGSAWRVELQLQPGRSVLDQRVELYNRSDVRHRYYWWSNGAVRVWDDSHLVYPTELMATHGFTAVEPWPIDRQGRDLSVIRNEVDGPVSLFTYQTREPFVGVYHPKPRPERRDLEKIRAAARELGFHFPVAVDEQWSVLRRWWLDGGDRSYTSVSFVVDREGKVRYVHPGGEFFPSRRPEEARQNRDYLQVRETVRKLIGKT